MNGLLSWKNLNSATTRIWHSQISSSTIGGWIPKPREFGNENLELETSSIKPIKYQPDTIGYTFIRRSTGIFAIGIHLALGHDGLQGSLWVSMGLLASRHVALEVGIGTVTLLGEIHAALVPCQGGLAATEEAVRLQPRFASDGMLGGQGRCHLGAETSAKERNGQKKPFRPTEIGDKFDPKIKTKSERPKRQAIMKKIQKLLVCSTNASPGATVCCHPNLISWLLPWTHI